MLSFIFGKGTGVSTPQELSRRREIARVLMERNAGQVPQTAWEGLNAIAEAIGARMENNRLDAAEAEGRERATAKFKALFNGRADEAPFGTYGTDSGAGESGPRKNASQQARWSVPPGNMSPVLGEVLSDPWLSEEQRSFVGSVFGPPDRSGPDAEEAVTPQPPNRSPVVRPRRPGVRQSIGGIDVNPGGTGMTVDKNGNIVGWP